MEAKDKIIKAKVRLQKDNPFFSYLVMNLNFREEKSVGSIAVNGKGDCFYNSKFIEELSDGELKGVLSHEVLHLALEHLQRLGNMDKEIFNIACDIVVNNILVNSNFDLPDKVGGLIPYNNSFQLFDKWITDLDKKGAEQVYDEIYKELNKKKKKKGKNKIGKERFDEHIYSEGEGDIEGTQKAKEKWKKAFSEASVYAKQHGNLPKGMERLLSDILNEKVNWKHLLYKYLTRTLPYDYTYSRPSKKSITSGFYMPSILRENIEIAVSVDTSGSISSKELGEFLSEIIGISRSFNNIKIRLIVCDAEIHEVYDMNKDDVEDIKNIKISGGGGTDHRPIYDYVENHFPHTKILVNFTDGYTDFPDYEKFKTIWVISKGGCKNDDIPFGEIINLD